MNRSIWYSQEQWRSFDITAFEHDCLVAIGAAVHDLLGSTTTIVSGIAATPTSPATLTVNLAAGHIYQQADADATSVGTIPQDTSTITQQGVYAGGQITLSAASIPAGQSCWFLVQAQFSQTDVVRTNDPNGGVPPFYNSANPAQPLNGQGGLGNASPTERQGLCIVQVISGVAATTGSETPPSPTGGWVPLYLIDLTNGQTQITSGEILTAGPSVGTNVPTNYPHAPFLAGLLNSHHSGNAGQAPQIKLTSEVQGVLPAANGGTSGVAKLNSQVFTASGTFTVPAGVTQIKVTVVGGGGASNGCNNSTYYAGASGGGGGWAISFISGLTPGATIPVTVGVGGASGTAVGVAAPSGGTSSFSSYCSATGGGGGGANTSSFASGGVGGTGAGGTINGAGSYGSDGNALSTGVAWPGLGGVSLFAGAGRAGSTTGIPGLSPGAGGGGPYGGATYAGSAGANGIVIVEW